MYKCKICGKKYTELTALYNHIESKHNEMIPKDMSVQQYYYYMKTGKMNGNCVMCKQPTGWNHNTGKYNRFCGNPKCKEEYVKIMKGRMVAKYGKTHLLNDPEKQREMLAHRSISGTYNWSDGKHESTYTGSYELDFLKTLDNFFDWDPEDISMPSPHTYTYKYEGEDRFYIPDVFIHSLDLEIEIKDGGDNPNNHHKIQEVDKEKERLKDEVMCSQKAFHYIKITNKNYENFFRFLKEIKKEFEKHEDEKKIPRIFKIEDIKGTSVKPVKESVEILEEDLRKKADDFIIDFRDFNNVPYKERDLFFSLRFDLVKDDPEKLKDYLTKLIKASRFEEDIYYVEKMAKKANDYYTLRARRHPETKDEYEKYYDWLKCGGIDKEIKERRKEKIKLIEGYEVVEEKFEPDKFLVWFDKPIQKLKGGKIKIYHGSSVKIKGDVFNPISINVGATKYSDPRWSTYAWDNREDAMTWAATWAIYEILGDKQVMYIGQNDNGQTLVAKPDGMTDKEFGMQLIKDTNEFYIYELEIDIKDLEIGSVPTVREYTVSKPAKILKRYDYKLNKEIIRRCINIVTQDQLDNYRKNFRCIREMPLHRGPILNNILKVGRDPYRALIRTEIQNGNIKPGVDDISDFKYSINRHYNNNTYNYESYIIDTMKESSISIPQMSYYLQNEYEEEMRNYLNTYKKYYNLMLEEQPAAVKHINEDIRKCLIVIDGMAAKGVENNLVQFAKDDLGEIVKASKHGKPVKVYETSGFKIPTKGDLWISTDWHFYKNKDNTKFKINPNIDKILNNYKKCVKPNDTFIFLGDLYDARTIFDMKLVPKIFDIKSLKGHKIMIKGNHDVNTTQFYLDLGFDEVYDKTYNIGNIVFSHEPIEVNDNEINIHGHIHFSETYWGMESTNHLDAYIEHYDFKPVKINSIIDEYRNTNRLTKKALTRFDNSIIHESMVEDLLSIDDSTNDINSITVQGDDVSISNEIIECKLVYNSENNRIFSLRDNDSKLIIENSYVIQRDNIGTHCSVTPYYKDFEEENVIEFQLYLNEKVDLSKLNNKLTNGITIASLYNINDERNVFIREACMRLFGVYPTEITMEIFNKKTASEEEIVDRIAKIYAKAVKTYKHVDYNIDELLVEPREYIVQIHVDNKRTIFNKSFNAKDYPNIDEKISQVLKKIK